MTFKKGPVNKQGQAQIYISGLYVGVAKFFLLAETETFIFVRKTGATVYVDRMSMQQYSAPSFLILRKTGRVEYGQPEIEFFGAPSKEFEYTRATKQTQYEAAVAYFKEMTNA